MTQLTEGAAREAAINYNFHFDLLAGGSLAPDDLIDDTDPDEDLDATEDFCNGA